MNGTLLSPLAGMDFYMIFHGRKEVPSEKNFVEKVASLLQVDLSPAELTWVKWLAFKNIHIPHSVDFGECWRDVPYTVLDREEITDLILYVKTAHTEKADIPQWFRDYHEFGITNVKSPYDNASGIDDDDST
jgi:hypothetical protein